MPRAHLIVGWIAVLTFIGTGVYLHFWARLGDMSPLEPARYALRANHVYILLSGLINLLASLSGAPHARRWRAMIGTAGGFLLLAAPAALFAAFVVEGPEPKPLRPLTAVGVLMLVVGTLAVLPGRRRAAE